MHNRTDMKTKICKFKRKRAKKNRGPERSLRKIRTEEEMKEK